MFVKKVALVVALLFFSVVMFSRNCLAVQLLTQEEALKQMLPDTDKIETETKTLTSKELTKIKERLGRTLTCGKKVIKTGEEKCEYSFYFGLKNGQKTGVAVIEEQPGKWGLIKFIIALDPVTGKVKNLAIMANEEKRGRPIASRNFLNQFIGKGSADPIKVRKDIRAVSGATVSSDTTSFAVKKVVVLYEELYLKKNSGK